MRRPLTAQRLSSTRISKRTAVTRTRHRPTTAAVNIVTDVMEETPDQESGNQDNVHQQATSPERSSSLESAVVEALPDMEAVQRTRSDAHSAIPISKPTRSKRTRRRPRSTPSHSISSNTAEQIFHQESRIPASEQEGLSSFAISNSMTPIIVEDLPDSDRPWRPPRVLEKRSQTRISKRTSSKKPRRHRSSGSSHNMSSITADQILDTESSNQQLNEATDESVAISNSTIPITVINVPESTAPQQELLNNSSQTHILQVDSPPDTDTNSPAINTNPIPPPTVEQTLEEELSRYLAEEAATPGGEQSGSTTLPAIHDVCNTDSAQGCHPGNLNAEAMQPQYDQNQRVLIPATTCGESSFVAPSSGTGGNTSTGYLSDHQILAVDVTENTGYVTTIFSTHIMSILLIYNHIT